MLLHKVGVKIATQTKTEMALQFLVKLSNIKFNKLIKLFRDRVILKALHMNANVPKEDRMNKKIRKERKNL